MVFARAESLGKGRNMIMSKDEYLITDEPLKALTIFAMPDVYKRQILFFPWLKSFR